MDMMYNGHVHFVFLISHHFGKDIDKMKLASLRRSSEDYQLLSRTVPKV
jgi:hypothetical protein